MRFYILLSFLCLGLVGLRGQQYSFKDISSLDGLSQDQVNAIYQDTRGLVWIATRVGLNCYDGQRMITFGLQQGLPHQFIAGITEDEKGYIWVLTRKGFSRFNGKDWSHFPSKEDVEYYGMLNLQLIDSTYILVNSFNQFPVFSLDGTYYTLEDKWPELKNLKYAEFYYQKKDSAFIYFNEHGSVLYRSKSGLIKQLNTDGKEYMQKLYCQDSIVYLSRKNDQELILYSFNLDTLHEVLRTRPSIQKIESELKLDLFYSFDDWIYMYDSRNQLQKRIKNLDNDRLGRELQFRPLNKEAFIQTTGISHLLSNKFINYDKIKKPWGLVKDNQGAIWVGLQKSGAGLIKIKDERIESVNFPECRSDNRKIMVTPEFYMGFNIDHSGNLYFAHAGGLLRLENNCLEELLPGSFPVLNTLFDERRKNIVVGSRKGVFILDSVGHRQYYSVDDGIHANSFIVSIGMDSKGRYWFGSFNGLTCWDPDAKKVIYNYSVKKYGKVLGGGVISMFTDKRENLWIGTASGLAILDNEYDLIRPVGRLEMPVYCNGIIGFNDGNSLLISSQYGLYAFDLDNYYKKGKIRYVFYNQYTGYLAKSPIQNNMILDDRGRVWIGSADYLVVFDPSANELISRELTPRLTAINGSKLPFVSELEQTVFKTNENNLNFSFNAIGFARPRETIFSYMLEGYDKDWSDWTSLGFANYYELPNGTYTFRVRTSGNKVLYESEEEACIEVIVKAPLLVQPEFPFLAASLVLISFLALGIVSYSTYRSRLAAKSKENENAFLRIQTLQAQMNPHFIFNSLSSIQHLVLTEERKKASDYLADFSSMVRLFLQSSFKANKYGEKRELFYTVSLTEEMELITTYIKFEKLIYSDRFDWRIDIDEDVIAEEIYIPPLLIQPFIENAIKHGLLKGSESKGYLDIQFSLSDDDDLKVVIQDNGPGFSIDKMAGQRTNKNHQSLGINLVVDRIRLLNQLGFNINLIVQGSPGKGTKVSMVFKDVIN